MRKHLGLVDEKLLKFFSRISVPLARLALFIVYFWFGFLKIIGASPASVLVYELHQKTISFIPFEPFYIGFAIFECLIGVLFLIKGAERIVLPLLLVHIFTTSLPLFFLPLITWQQFLVPTLEGQYIIKNVLLIAAAIAVVAKLETFNQKN